MLGGRCRHWRAHWPRIAVGLVLAACRGAQPDDPDRGGATADSTGRAPVRMVEYEARVPVDSEVTLHGVLSLPASRSGAVGAVLLVAGSGPQDRDGARTELPGYAPWRDVRDALVQHGLAVLRLDDRGVGASTGRFAGATTDDFAADARAALVWLGARAEVDHRRMAIVGHSEGAVVSLLVAARTADVRALVLLGAPSRTGREIAAWQRQTLVASDRARWPPAERAAVLATASAQADSLAAHDPWLHRWFSLDPRAIARDVRTPVLLIHGANDRQVPPDQADELATALRGAGASPVEVQHFGDTDHLLLVDHDGDPQGYVRLADRHIRPAVLRALTRFLSVHVGPR